MKLLQYLPVFLCGVSLFCGSCSEKEPRVIDERENEKTLKSTIPIAKVWAGHPVGFALMTEGQRQYVAFYDENRHMVLGQRELSGDAFELHTMPLFDREEGKGTSTILNWDSHNSVTFAKDKEGYIHVSGNMHVHPLTYFRSKRPNDISEMVQIRNMVGTEEDRCTYPKFMKDREGNLIFHYRDGGSGSGNEIYNIYDTKTETWKRLLDTPLTDGKGEMNAYASQPELYEDDWYHMYWVWRDTPDCETNHDLSYMKSPDLVNWYDVHGKPISLPATIDQTSLIVDPIPVKGGIINLAAKLCLDPDHNPLMAYHKYDGEGNLQFYVARYQDGEWEYKQVTDWDYRWEFSGRGSINSEVRVGEFKRREDGTYELGYDHVKYGQGTILLDEDLNPIGEVIKPESYISTLEVEGDFPGLEIRSSRDLGSAPNASNYLLKWETLPRNRDRPRPEPWPGPSQLYLFELE